MGESVKTVVIDASVALSWLLPDEQIAERANRLYSRYVSGDIDLVAPVLLMYEVVNGIRSAILRKRLRSNRAEEAMLHFKELGIRLENQDKDIDRIFRMARKLRISAYDAAYIALARKFKATLYTADSHLYKKVGDKVRILLI